MRLGIVRTAPRATPRALAVRNLDAIIVNSTEIRDVWLESAPWFSPNDVFVVLNGVRSRLAERAMLRSQLRGELKLGDETILIGGAGHIAPRKGFDFLLRAFALADLPDAAVAIAGDGPHKSELELLATELGLGDRVRWLGHRNDGAGAIGGFDLFVLSSHNEGMANVMLEAMAGGTPVIASDVSGVRKAIAAAQGRPDAGWIVPPADVEALAVALREACAALRNKSEKIRQVAEEAHWRTENWFSPERMVEECEAILFTRE